MMRTHPLFFSLILLVITIITCNSGHHHLSSFTSAWSPSDPPVIWDRGTPSGLKFGDVPTTTQCCFSTTANLFCITTGSDRDRVRLQKFTKTPFDLTDEWTIDPTDSMKLRACSFATARNNTFAVAGLQTKTTNQLAAIVFDPSTASVYSMRTFANCPADTPTFGAFLLDNDMILASAGVDGIAKIKTIDGPFSCDLMKFAVDPEDELFGAKTFGGFVSPGVNDISFWVTDKATFKYNVALNKIEFNTTLVNTSVHALASANGATSYIYTRSIPTPGTGGSPTYLLHKVQDGATPSLLAQAATGQEFVGFIKEAAGELYAGIRMPYLGLAYWADINQVGTVSATTADATGYSAADAGSALPSGSTFFQTGTPPTIFSVFDIPSNSLFLFATPKAQTGIAANLNLPTLGLAFDTNTKLRRSHYVNRAGTTTVASSIVGSGSFFIVLSSTPSTIVMVNAADLSQVQDEFQQDMLNSTDLGNELVDSICAFDTSKYLLYVAGTTASTIGSPVWIAKFYTGATTPSLNYKQTITLSAGKLQGATCLSTAGDVLYVAGKTTTANRIYVDKIDTTFSTMSLNHSVYIDNMGNRVISAKIDPAENYLLLVTDKKALVRISIAGGVINAASATVIIGRTGAQTVAVDRYGFATVGYNSAGEIDVVHVETGALFVDQHQVDGETFNLIRKTDDDNYLALSVVPGSFGTPPTSSLFAVRLDFITQNPLVSTATQLDDLSSPITVSSVSGFSFALGRNGAENEVAIYRSGSRTDYMQHRELTSNAKRTKLITPNNGFGLMTREAAKNLCISAGTNGLVDFFDDTELDALRGLFDQEPVWVAGQHDGSRWVWPSGDPPQSWWANEFPFQPNINRCAYVRQGKIFNGNCNLNFLPACSTKFQQVNKGLVEDSIPTLPWITMHTRSRSSSSSSDPQGGVYGLRRVDFVSNFFECQSQPWSDEIDWNCGAAWDTAIFGSPQDVQMVSETKLFVATTTSLYEVDLISSSQNLIRQYNTFRRKMQVIQKWNLTVVYGESRTDFIASYGTGLRNNVLTLNGDAACDNVQFVDDEMVICVTRAKITRYTYTIDKATFRLTFSDATIIAGEQLNTQKLATSFHLTNDNTGVLKMSVFDDLVTQDVGFNASASAPDVCQIVGYTAASATASSTSFTTYTAMTIKSATPGTSCDAGKYTNCIKTQIPLVRRGVDLDCSGGTPLPAFPRPTKTLGWVNEILATVANQNGQVALSFCPSCQVPSDRPTEVFQVTSNALEDGLVTIAFTVKDFPCLSRASDLSTYCLSTITSCNPSSDNNCYETYAYGPVKFADNCDVVRYCTATIMTAFNVYDHDDSSPTFVLTEKMILNAETFSGDLDTLIQLNITGEPTSRVATFDNRLAIFQDVGNASKIEVDRSTSWLTRDEAARSFNLMHPTVATLSDSATAATLMTETETLFMKKSTETITGPGKDPIYYAVAVHTDDIDELDNVVKCGVKTEGVLRFAPSRDPDTVMPPLIVDSLPPSTLGAARGDFENVTGLVDNSSTTMDVSSGNFSLLVNCNVTMSLQLFITYSDGAVGSIPFYILGKDVSGVAGPPPATISYPPIPANPLQYTNTANYSGVQSGLNTASSLEDIQTVFDAIRVATPVPPGGWKINVTVSVAPDLGSLVLSDNIPSSIASPMITPGKSNAITKNSINLNLVAPAFNVKELFDKYVAFYPAPAAVFRNLTDNSALNLVKWEISNLMAGNSMDVVATPITAIPLRNTGPQIVLDPCNVTIVVGHEILADFGQVFKHEMNMDMEITSKIVYRAGSRGQNIDITCNKTGFCWAVFETIASTTNFELTATDGFFYKSHFCGVYGEFVNLRVNQIPPTYHVHAGSTFSYSIPTTLFLSSSSWSISSVSMGSFALESGLSFQSPLLITGAFSKDQIYNLTITATNGFGSAVGYIIFNSTNVDPSTAGSYTFHHRALIAFEEEITLNTLVTDADNDALQFTIEDPGLVEKWLQTSISPGTMTTSPQLLTIKGTAPASFAGQTETLRIRVDDSWSSTEIFIYIVMRPEYLVAVPQSNSSSYSHKIHPGSSFSIPFNMTKFFNSSTDWNFEMEVEPSSDYPISNLDFTLPNVGSSIGYVTGLIEGTDALETKNVTILAKSPFMEAETHLIIHPQNKAPNYTSIALSQPHPINLGTFHASHSISVDQVVSNYFFDADLDPLNFDVTPKSTVDSWITSMISFSPEGYSLLPKTLTIKGTIPVYAMGKNVTLDLVCDDKWNQSSIELLIVIPEARKPVLVKPIRNFTVIPEESISEVLALTPEYFTSPDGDALTVSVQVVTGASWVTATLQGDQGAEKLTLSAAPSVVADATAEVLVSVKNPFGNVTEAKIIVNAEMTDWQRIQATAILVVSIASGVLSILGLWVYYPMIIGWCKGSRVVKKCPLSASKSPKYHFPEDCEDVKVLIREDKFKFLSVMSHWLWNYYTLKPAPRVGPPCYIKVYDKHIALRLDREYDLDDPPADCYVQFFDGDGIILEEFDCFFREVMEVPENQKSGIFHTKQNVVSKNPAAESYGFFAIDLPPRANPLNSTNENTGGKNAMREPMREQELYNNNGGGLLQVPNHYASSTTTAAPLLSPNHLQEGEHLDQEMQNRNNNNNNNNLNGSSQLAQQTSVSIPNTHYQAPANREYSFDDDL